MKDVESRIPKNELSLLDQFSSTEDIEVNGKNIKVVDIEPKDRKTETPTLMIGGFSATPDALKDSILQTAEAGRRVISAYAPHGGGRLK